MNSKSETGHSKNIDLFEDLITAITTFGNNYNPAFAQIKLSALNTLYNNATNALTDLKDRKTDYVNAVNNRILLFSQLKQLSTRVISALKASGATKETVKDALAIARKIRGKRAKPLEAETPNIPTPNSISVAQLSYDQLKEHFSKLLSLVKSEPGYNPNENDLKVASLTVFLTALKTANTDVGNMHAKVMNSKATRNRILYKEDTGIVDISKKVKSYVLSVYNSTSAEYKLVSGIAIRKLGGKNQPM